MPYSLPSNDITVQTFNHSFLLCLLLQLADYGGMANQDKKMFGSVLFGVDAVEEKIAEAADERHSHFKTGNLVKEHFPVPAVLCGAGMGKSTVAGRHCSILRARCKDPDLKLLLETHPLIINITFNSVMSYEPDEAALSPAVCLARRMLASYLRIPWAHASRLMLDSSDPRLVWSTLRLLVAHHKAQRGVDAAAQIVVILSVDEINSIPDVLCLGSPDRRDEAVRIMGLLAKCLRGLSLEGVANNCPVIPLVAGTAQEQFRAATMGSGVLPLVQSLSVLSVDDVYAALRSCGVNEQYLQDPDLIRLLDETGGVPRLVRYVLEGLTEQYDHSRIPIARMKVEEYIKVKTPFIPLAAVHALLPMVLMGKAVSAASTLSATSLDDLQRLGSVWLNQVPGTADDYHVIIPLMSLRRVCMQHETDAEVGRVMYMIDLLRGKSWEDFEEFLGCYHAFLSRTLARTRRSVTLGQLYKGVEMDSGIAAIKLELSGDKDYTTMNRLAGTSEHRFPLSKGLRSNTKATEQAALVASKLLQGAVVLNSAGAPVDVLQTDPLVNDDGILVRAVCVMHTIEHTVLSVKKVLADRKKAIEAVQDCKQLCALCEEGESPKCVTIHITNAVVHKDLQPAKRDAESTKVVADEGLPREAIVIGQHNMEAFFGPVLSRALWPYRKPLPMRKRGPLVESKVESKTSGRMSEYCALSAPPSVSTADAQPVRGNRKRPLESEEGELGEGDLGESISAKGYMKVKKCCRNCQSFDDELDANNKMSKCSHDKCRAWFCGNCKQQLSEHETTCVHK